MRLDGIRPDARPRQVQQRQRRSAAVCNLLLTLLRAQPALRSRVDAGAGSPFCSLSSPALWRALPLLAAASFFCFSCMDRCRVTDGGLTLKQLHLLHASAC